MTDILLSRQPCRADDHNPQDRLLMLYKTEDAFFFQICRRFLSDAINKANISHLRGDTKESRVYSQNSEFIISLREKLIG